MRSQHHIWIVAAAIAGLAGCHHGPTALSADGDVLREGQSAYAKHATFACKSSDELQKALDIRSQGDKAAFFAYLQGRCGLVDTPEAVKILTIEPGGGDQFVAVKDLDDQTQWWTKSSWLTLNK